LAFILPGSDRALAGRSNTLSNPIGGRKAWGANAYGLHGKRFNYLFFDGHVNIYKITDTVGTGTTNAPKGMWTMIAGD
jgi:prepilin-type processing-associated H-X9-DG protein